jgi:predicted RecB family nuclease
VIITTHLFEAYLNCPTKCFLRSLGETGTGNSYAEWTSAQNHLYRRQCTRELSSGYANDECITGSLDRKSLRAATWLLATESTIRTRELETTIDAIERVPLGDAPDTFQLIPTRFIRNEKIGPRDKLLLGFDALILAETLGRDVKLGKIISGDTFASLKVNTDVLKNKIATTSAKIIELTADNKPPDLVLNRHCPECEFRDRCRQKATEADDLSLLACMTEQERKRQRSKGIFTVRQLSYTFRPRRTPKRAKKPAQPHYAALQALAIRENTVYVHGTPIVPDAKAQVYLDIEGLPDRDSYYLIGALIVCEGQETFHSFWASDASQEPHLFIQLADTLRKLPDFRILHFGDYEAVALKRMRAKLPQTCQRTIDALLDKSTNILSVIHRHIYFPTYSNGLKDLGRFLGFERSQNDATGLQTIIWRTTWNETRSDTLKERLIQYNQDDCRALWQICKFVRELITSRPGTVADEDVRIKAMQTETLLTERDHWDMFRPREYASKDFSAIAKYAYFDYQRDKVLIRTHPEFRVISKTRRKLERANNRPNLVVSNEKRSCPQCHSRAIEKCDPVISELLDLKFFKGGMKKWITRVVCWKYRCSACGHHFRSKDKRPQRYRFGHALMSWCAYSNVACGINLLRVKRILGDVCALTFPDSSPYRAKSYIAERYHSLYAEILQSILASPVIHIDETTVHLRKHEGYVWVLTSLDKAYYFFKPSREGSFLAEMLRDFVGVLVSDFFTAYDSLRCNQQKCLVHLVRDIDDDLLRHPLDGELKEMAQQFGTLLRTIIDTVDKYGLRRRHLHKHKPSVDRFLDNVAAAAYSSPLATKYQKRFGKSGNKMFTFLEYDGIPWNNNNAEHAIKRFAKYRRDADGKFTQRSLEEYLVLATVFETCAFNNVNILKFLLSGEATLGGLLRMAGR